MNKIDSRYPALSAAPQRQSVVSFVLDRIKQAIINGEIAPGDTLPSEVEMTASLGVGKTSIREALKMLQAVGAVEIRQGHGTVLRSEPGPDMLTPLIFQLLLKDGTPTELIEFRKLVEPSYSLCAMEKAGPEDLAALEAAVERLESNIRNSCQTADDDLAFHRVILAATRNPYMISIGNTILELFRGSIEKSMQDRPNVAATDHRAILEAFKARDAEKLLAAIQNSYEGWSQSLQAQETERELGDWVEPRSA